MVEKNKTKYNDFELCTRENIEKKVKVFLNLFELRTKLQENGNGYVLDRKEKVLGNITFKEPNLLETSFSYKDSSIKTTLPLYDSIVYRDILFEIENSNGKFSGILSQTKDFIERLNFDYLDALNGIVLNKENNNKITESIQISNKSTSFQYSNYQTRETIKISRNFLSTGIIFGIYEPDKYVSIYTDFKGENIETVVVIDGEEYLDTEHFLKEIDRKDDIWKQIEQLIILLYPSIYDKIDKIIQDYNHIGNNILETVIRKTCLQTFSKEQLECCFGKNLVKKLTNSHK